MLLWGIEAETKSTRTAYWKDMELYFKDFEDKSGDTMSAGSDGDCGTMTASQQTALEDAFAELSERVSAARLVY